MDAASEKTPSQKKPLLINRNYSFLWTGQAISNLGDMVFDTTLVLWVATRIALGQTWAPLAVSGVMLSAALPMLLVGPLTGVFVDRWDKRRTMLCMDATRAILVVLLLLAAFPLPFLPGGHLPTFVQLGLIYAVVTLASACAQFFNPARMTIISDVVDESERAKAGGLGQISMNLAILIGPPLAAPLLFVVGVHWALIINALSFVASFVAILSVRIPQNLEQASTEAKQPHNFWNEFGAGLRFFAHSRVLMTLLLSLLIVALGTGALNALDVFFVTQNLHTNPNLYGIIGMAFAAGSILGALLSAFFTQRLGVVRIFWGSLVTSGLLLLIYSRQTSIVSALFLYLLIGFSIAVLNTAFFPLLLHAAPREFLGRVNSILNPSMSLASLISVALAGFLASNLLLGFHATALGLTFGPIDTIFSTSAILIILGGIYALISLRQVRLDEKASEVQEKAATA
jgi:MFS family permease